MPENRRRFRNPVARSPLLRKGGPHQRSRSGERHEMHQGIRAELEDWLDELEEMKRQCEEPVSKGTGSSFSGTLYMVVQKNLAGQESRFRSQHA